MPYFGLVVLAVVFGALIVRRPFLVKHLTLIVFATSAAVFGWLVFLSIRQHQIWEGYSLTRLFLPPYQDYGYFIFYIFFRFFLPYLISFAVAGLFYWLMVLANKKSDCRFFEKEEPALAFLAVFLVGHPGWIVYFVCIILIYFIWHLVGKLRGEKNIRLPLYYLWLAMAVFVILIMMSGLWRMTPWWGLLEI